MEIRWISPTRKVYLALMMILATTYAWAERLAQYDFRVILSKDKTSMEQIQKKLDAGADFGKMAMENSIDRNSAKEGGLMRHARASELQPIFADELESLKPGQRSAKPRNSEFGWFVIKLESVKMTEDDTQERLKAHEQLAEQRQLDREREAKAKAEFDKVKTKFESCARRARDLDGESEELQRRIDMYNLGSGYSESELRSDLARFKRKESRFESDCSEVRYNEEIAKVCSHPAYQSRWCSSFR
jgi:hypothetical protein